MVDVSGSASTSMLAVTPTQPVSVSVKVKVTLPAATPVTIPPLVTVATASSLLAQTPPVAGVKVIVFPTHTVGEEAATIGSGLTVTTVSAVLLQPFESVTVTVYIPLETTVIVALVAALDHRYPVPPDAVRSTDPPWQKVVGPLGVITAVGGEFTDTVTLPELVQPAADVEVAV